MVLATVAVNCVATRSRLFMIFLCVGVLCYVSSNCVVVISDLLVCVCVWMKRVLNESLLTTFGIYIYSSFLIQFPSLSVGQTGVDTGHLCLSLPLLSFSFFRFLPWARS